MRTLLLEPTPGRQVRVLPRPPEALALRNLRHALGFDVHAAAEALEVTAVDVGLIERGLMRPAVPSTWADLMAALWGAR